LIRPGLHYDAVVIGVGVAGLTAATCLAEAGAKVCLVAKGVGSTHLAPGTVDVLGYDLDRVADPAVALPEFVANHPAHPYALVGVDAIAPALEWFRSKIEDGPQPSYSYVGDLSRNHLLPTAVGAIRPSALVPETAALGDVGGADGSVCVVGIRVLRDFHSSLCADNLRRSGIDARSIELDVDVGRAEANSLGLARRFDDPGFRAAFAARLVPLLRGEERVGLPAILGLHDPHGAWTELQQRVGHPVFEIPTLPPSAPGMRVYNALTAALRAAGGRIVLGAEVAGSERDGERVTEVRTHASGHDHIYRARWVVLASGGFASGAIELGSDWQAREKVLGLSLSGVPGAGEPRFDGDYFADHPIARAGVSVDSALVAHGTDNVLVAGAALPGAEPWREGSGEGIAITSGHFVAQSVREREGATTTA
jgi:glycerol-3-phosphate dehydrogenase subunit B